MIQIAAFISLFVSLSINLLFTSLAFAEQAPSRPRPKSLSNSSSSLGQAYSFEVPSQGEFQTRLAMGLQTGTLKATTATSTEKIEGIETRLSAAYGLTSILSLGVGTSYVDSSTKSHSLNSNL